MYDNSCRMGGKVSLRLSRRLFDFTGSRRTSPLHAPRGNISQGANLDCIYEQSNLDSIGHEDGSIECQLTWRIAKGSWNRSILNRDAKVPWGR